MLILLFLWSNSPGEVPNAKIGIAHIAVDTVYHGQRGRVAEKQEPEATGPTEMRKWRADRECGWRQGRP